MKNEEKLALVDRIRQHSGIKDILLADIGYLKGVSGTGMQIEKIIRINIWKRML